MNRPITRAVFFCLPAAILLFLPVASSGLPRSNEDETYSSNLQVEARLTAKDFSPDGDLSKEVWKKAKWIEFDHNPSGKLAYPAQRPGLPSPGRKTPSTWHSGASTIP